MQNVQIRKNVYFEGFQVILNFFSQNHTYDHPEYIDISNFFFSLWRLQKKVLAVRGEGQNFSLQLIGLLTPSLTAARCPKYSLPQSSNDQREGNQKDESVKM